MSNKSTDEELEKRIKELEKELGQCRYAEEELRKSQYYMDRITSAMYESLLVLDPDMKIKDVNDGFLREYGVTREEIVGRTCHEVTHGSDTPCSGAGHACPVRKVLETGKPTRVEHFHRGKKGEKLIIEVYAFPLIGDDGKVENVVEVHHNVTDLRRVEQEQAQRERLEGVLEMAAAVCHELNQPLTALSLYCDRLLEGESQEGQVNNHIRYVLDKVNRMGAITKKLQSITRYETKEYVPGMKIVDIDKASQAP